MNDLERQGLIDQLPVLVRSWAGHVDRTEHKIFALPD